MAPTAGAELARKVPARLVSRHDADDGAQVVAIWVGHSAQGVSLLSWAAYLFSACLWFVYGIQKGDKTIYLACVGWILLDAAIVVGVVVYG